MGLFMGGVLRNVAVFTVQNDFANVNDIVITSIFTFEVALGMIAHGIVIGRYSFISFSAWNKLDVFVVITAWVNILNIGAGSFGFLRALRVLRVLKALKHERFRGIRKIINSLAQSIPLLQNVVGLSFFAFYLFAVFGLNMFMGRLRGRCEGMPSHMNSTGGRTCEEWFAIGSNARINDSADQCPPGCAYTMGAEHELCQVRGQCYANFDNIVWAVLTVFRSVSMEGWTDICYVYMSVAVEGYEWVVIAYFVLLLLLVTHLVVNLFVAVICTQFAGTRISTQGQEDLLKLRRLRGLWLQQDPTGDAMLRSAELRRILRKVLTSDQKVEDAMMLMKAARQRAMDDGSSSPRSRAHTLADSENTNWRFDELLSWARGDSIVPLEEEEEQEEEEEKCVSRFINWLERLTGIDIDGDGDIGVMGTTTMIPELSDTKAGEEAAKAQQLTLEMREQKMFAEREETLEEGRRCPATIQRACLAVCRMDAFNNFILSCVILNTIFLSLEHHGQSATWTRMLLYTERVFLVVFTCEMMIKWLGMGFKNYLGFNANKFYFLLVSVSLFEQGVIIGGGDGALGPLSVLRSFR